MNEFVIDIQHALAIYYHRVVQLLPRLVMAVVVLLVLIYTISVLSNWMSKRFDHRLKDPILAQFFVRIVKGVLLVMSVVIAMNIGGFTGTAGSLLAGAGIGAFVIGFAFKDIGENFLAGIIMAFDRPFRYGDTVELSGVKGNVVNMNLRDTHLRTTDGRDVYAPNSGVMKSPVVNFTLDGFLQYDFTVRVPKQLDLAKVVQEIETIVGEGPQVLGHDHPPGTRVTEVTDSGHVLNVTYWLSSDAGHLAEPRIRTQLVQRVSAHLDNAVKGLGKG